jgi:lipopolysaccharide transport system ATP-binding protein
LKTVIRIENISKDYHLGEVGTGTISRDINAWLAKIRGKENPNLKINENPKSFLTGEIHKALDNVSFDVQEGDVLGIIGKNGAGKSTMLKILSRVTTPTEGSFKVKGRIASLLEVGTGFHPELTGRDNIYLNGAILGMRKQEIKSKFDEIVDFSGVEKFIDTPVKRYSSGMYVRLAFAVAAHLEPEILIIDEVLAVGDIAFQNKCMGKMSEVSKQGRTVLFVSHNMAAVQRLCKTGILLEDGKLKYSGETTKVIEEYFKSSFSSRAVFDIPLPENTSDVEGFAYRLQIEDLKGNPISTIPVGKKWQVRIYFRMNKRTSHFIIGIGISNTMDVNFRTTWSSPMEIEKGEYEIIFRDTNILMSAGEYKMLIGLTSFQRSIQYAENIAVLRISEIDEINDERILRISGNGLVLNPMEMELIKK